MSEVTLFPQFYHSLLEFLPGREKVPDGDALFFTQYNAKENLNREILDTYSDFQKASLIPWEDRANE